MENKMEVQRENKSFSIDDFKVEKEEDGAIFITGYANTKGKADRYGDVPTVFSKLRDYVYDLKEFKKNPVLLVDHNNSATAIVGTFNKKMGGVIQEDEKGLRFKARLMDSSPDPKIQHVLEAYKKGFGRALSIGGIWQHENKDKPEQLTLAVIFEISLVGVGADSNALTEKSLPKKGEQENPEIGASTKAGRVLSKANENKLKQMVEIGSTILKSLEKEKEEDKSWVKVQLR